MYLRTLRLAVTAENSDFWSKLASPRKEEVDLAFRVLMKESLQVAQ
jgi:hypothetical protein